MFLKIDWSMFNCFWEGVGRLKKGRGEEKKKEGRRREERSGKKKREEQRREVEETRYKVGEKMNN